MQLMHPDAGPLSVLVLLLFSTSAHAGTHPDWQSGVQGQWGAIPVLWAPDGSAVLLTQWDRAGLLFVPVDGSSPTILSTRRGAGFHPVFHGRELFFKEVLQDDGLPARQYLVRKGWTGEGATIIDKAELLGDPSVSDGGLLVWTSGNILKVLDLEAMSRPRELPLPGYSNLAEVDPAGERVAFNHPDGSIGVITLSTGETRWLTPPGAYNHPDWSPDGSLLLLRGPGPVFSILDPSNGDELLQTTGTEPVWMPDSRNLLFARMESDAFTINASRLWLLSLETGAQEPMSQAASHLRFPSPTPSGSSLAFIDVDSGNAMIAALEKGESITSPEILLPAHALPDMEPHLDSRDKNAEVYVPYMHQLWDTPDDFDGSWSCGPTSCIQTIQKYGKLADHDITCSWPYEHTSPWGWYVPNEYDYNGYTYDVWGLAAGDVWVQGAHGFICRELGAAYWAYMEDFANQHDVTSWWAGTSFSTLMDEIDAGYPMYASSTVLGYGHIIVLRGYDTDHSIIVNDPYGDANSGDWGNYDGEAVVYDWPGYNNGNLEITISQIFGAEGPLDDPVEDWGASWYNQSYPSTMVAGQVADAYVEYMNDGFETWAPGATFLGTTEPRDRESEFEDPGTWYGSGRPATVDDMTAQGETGRFSFQLRAPQVQEETVFEEHWGLVEEWVTWFGPPDDQVFFRITVLPEGSNIPPEADAGYDRVAFLGMPVELDASRSQDQDGSIVSWTWDVPNGTLEGEVVEWTPDSIGSYEIVLTVTDDVGDTGRDTVMVQVNEDLEVTTWTRWADDSGGECGCSLLPMSRNLSGGAALVLLVGLLVQSRRRATPRQGTPG